MLQTSKFYIYPVSFLVTGKLTGSWSCSEIAVMGMHVMLCAIENTASLVSLISLYFYFFQLGCYIGASAVYVIPGSFPFFSPEKKNVFCSITYVFSFFL